MKAIMEYAPSSEDALAAVRAGRDAALIGAPRDSVPSFVDVDDVRTRRLWRLTAQVLPEVTP